MLTRMLINAVNDTNWKIYGITVTMVQCQTNNHTKINYNKKSE